MSAKKKLVNELLKCSSAVECTENTDETRLVEITSAKNENKHKHSSCTLYLVLFSIFFATNVWIGIAIFFIFIVTSKKISFVLSLITTLKQQVNELIDGRSQTNTDQKSNLLFSQRHNQSQKCRIKLVKNRQKTLQKYWYFLYWMDYN